MRIFFLQTIQTSLEFSTFNSNTKYKEIKHSILVKSKTLIDCIHLKNITRLHACSILDQSFIAKFIINWRVAVSRIFFPYLNLNLKISLNKKKTPQFIYWFNPRLKQDCVTFHFPPFRFHRLSSIHDFVIKPYEWFKNKLKKKKKLCWGVNVNKFMFVCWYMNYIENAGLLYNFYIVALMFLCVCV